MGVLDAIKNVADGADAVKRIHDTGEYFTSKYIKISRTNAKPLSINAPKQVKVNQPVTISIFLISSLIRGFVSTMICILLAFSRWAFP